MKHSNTFRTAIVFTAVLSALLTRVTASEAKEKTLTYETIATGTQQEADLTKLIKKHMVKPDRQLADNHAYIFNSVGDESDRRFQLAVEKLDKSGEKYFGQ